MTSAISKRVPHQRMIVTAETSIREAERGAPKLVHRTKAKRV
jgi:hypothetical protein